MRTAVSNSCEFIRNPPSPVTATTRRSGCASLATTALRRAMPTAANPFEMMQVLGRKHGKRRPMPDFVRANIRDHDIIVGQRRTQIGKDSLRLEGEGRVLTALCQFLTTHLAKP